MVFDKMSDSEKDNEVKKQDEGLESLERSSKSTQEQERKQQEEVLKVFDTVVEQMNENLEEYHDENINVELAENGFGRRNNEFILKEFAEELKSISDAELSREMHFEEEDGQNGEIMKIVALSAMAAKITEEEKREKLLKKSSSEELSSDESDSNRSNTLIKMENKIEEDSVQIPLPPPPLLLPASSVPPPSKFSNRDI